MGRILRSLFETEFSSTFQIFPDRQMFDKIDNLTIEAMSEWEKSSQTEVESEGSVRKCYKYP